MEKYKGTRSFIFPSPKIIIVSLVVSERKRSRQRQTDIPKNVFQFLYFSISKQRNYEEKFGFPCHEFPKEHINNFKKEIKSLYFFLLL